MEKIIGNIKNYDKIDPFLLETIECVTETGMLQHHSYKEDSKLRTIMVDTYKSLFNKEPEVSSIHAGLECGLFVGKCPDLDCVSFGPNLWDVHSFNERLDIASTERTYEYLKEILRRCK